MEFKNETTRQQTYLSNAITRMDNGICEIEARVTEREQREKSLWSGSLERKQRNLSLRDFYRTSLIRITKLFDVKQGKDYRGRTEIKTGRARDITLYNNVSIKTRLNVRYNPVSVH